VQSSRRGQGSAQEARQTLPPDLTGLQKVFQDHSYFLFFFHVGPIPLEAGAVVPGFLLPILLLLLPGLLLCFFFGGRLTFILAAGVSVVLLFFHEQFEFGQEERRVTRDAVRDEGIVA